MKNKEEIDGQALFRQTRKAKFLYIDQLICLMSLTLMATVRSGLRALVLVAASVVVSVLVDMICCGLSKKTYNPRDISTVTAGFCIALMMPVSVSYSMIIGGAALAIGIKHIFGGKDNYIFNPTAVTLAFLIICYPASMLLYPKTGDILPVFGEITVSLSSGIESFLMKLGTAQEMEFLDVMLGNFQGPMGTTHVLVIIVCAVCLLFRRSISVTATLAALLTTIAVAAMFPLYDDFMNTLIYELVGGYLLFGLLFLANDPQTVPKTELGRFYYGVTLGALAIMFRYFGKVEGSFVFALLIANTLSLRLDGAAEKSIAVLDNIYDILRRRVSTYERFRETAKTGASASIYDTQEIVIDSINYDMPPIDNKVIKINRKKRGIVTITREKLAPYSEKDTEKVFKSTTTHSAEDYTAQVDISRHVAKQMRSFTASLSIFASNTAKRFRKTETVQPVRHKSQLTMITEKTAAEEAADFCEGDMEISDFDGIETADNAEKDEVTAHE